MDDRGPGPDAGGQADQDFASLVAAAADVSVVKTADGHYRYVSPGSLRLLGWQPGALEGHLEDHYVHPDDLLKVQAAREQLADEEFLTLRYRLRCEDGTHRWIEDSSRLVEAGGAWVVVATLRDITERLRYEEQLQERARTDPLTGVANRTVLMDHIQQGLRRLERGSGGLAVLYADVDRFKVFNDSLGHHIGDTILQGIAEQLASCLRPADTLARLGGDEFVVVADGLPDRAEAIKLGDRLAEAVRRGVQVDDEVYECTISVGVTWTSEPGQEPPALLRAADLALYRAKERGRDRVEPFDDDLRTAASSRMSTERMLRRAVVENRVVVEYQPIIDLRTARPVSAEALVRIRRTDTAELVGPEMFLTVAEDAGLLRPIDDLVLTRAVDQADQWLEHFDGRFGDIAVNITARHLADSRFPATVADLLGRCGLPHERLHVELTERTLIQASRSALSALRTLRSIGLKVGLDDFGSGFSSLAYLRQFPLDFVKIDRSFIHDLDADGGGSKLVGAIIDLAHALDLAVVAEGVETEGQRRVLEDLGCDQAQGFLFGRPTDPETLGARVASSDDRW